MPVYVLGMGNKLLKDDGLGVRVAEELQKKSLPDVVKVLDIGTGILRALPELVKADRIIVVDAIRAGGEPGSIYNYRGFEAKIGVTRSVHDIQFEEVLAQLALLGHTPKIEFYGIEPKEISFSMELSGVVEEKILPLVNLISSRLIPPNHDA